MVRQGKLNPIKIGRKNLRVCQLRVGRLVGREIFILQTIHIYKRNLPEYLRIPLESDNGEIKDYKMKSLLYMSPPVLGPSKSKTVVQLTSIV